MRHGLELRQRGGHLINSGATMTWIESKKVAAAAKKGRLSASTNPKGDRLDIKEKKKQQRMRGQDAHNGVWKSEQEMQLRCTFD